MSKDEYLAHYGIPGQKWGVRNYENYDGTLTEEGRERYGYDGDGDGRSASSGERTKKSFDKEKLKKAAIVGGAVAAAVLGTYGAYKISQLNGQINTGLNDKIAGWQRENDFIDILREHDNQTLKSYGVSPSDIQPSPGVKQMNKQYDLNKKAINYLNKLPRDKMGNFARKVDSGIDKAKTFVTNTAPTTISNKLAPYQYKAGQAAYSIKTMPAKIKAMPSRIADNAEQGIHNYQAERERQRYGRR